MMDPYWALKVTVIVLLLRHLRIFGVQSTIIYIAGVIAAYIFRPEEYLFAPENILAMSVVIFASYMVAASTIDLLYNWNNIELKRIFRKDSINRMVDFFLGMFVISWAMSFLSLPFVESFLLIVVIFLGIDILGRQRKELSPGSIFKSGLVFALLHILFFNRFDMLGYLLMQSFFACGIFFVFSFVRFFNVYPCPISQLEEGMIPAETVVLEGGHYKKVRGDYFSLPYYLRRRVTAHALGKTEAVMPFRALTADDVDLLRKTEFEMLRVQKVIDLRIFVLIGVAIALLL